MEIKELISFYIDDISNSLEVTFRTIDDQEDELRQDNIDLEHIGTFGYDFLPNKSNDIIDEETYYDNDEEYEDPNDSVDMEDVVSFLNEYYLIYPKRLPDSELF